MKPHFHFKHGWWSIWHHRAAYPYALPVVTSRSKTGAWKAYCRYMDLLRD